MAPAPRRTMSNGAAERRAAPGDKPPSAGPALRVVLACLPHVVDCNGCPHCPTEVPSVERGGRPGCLPGRRPLTSIRISSHIRPWPHALFLAARHLCQLPLLPGRRRHRGSRPRPGGLPSPTTGRWDSSSRGRNFRSSTRRASRTTPASAGRTCWRTPTVRRTLPFWPPVRRCTEPLEAASATPRRAALRMPPLPFLRLRSEVFRPRPSPPPPLIFPPSTCNRAHHARNRSCNVAHPRRPR